MRGVFEIYDSHTDRLYGYVIGETDETGLVSGIDFHNLNDFLGIWAQVRLVEKTRYNYYLDILFTLC